MQVLLVIASMIWGINVIVMKVVMNTLPLYMVAGVRVFFSSVMIALILGFTRQSIKISKKQGWILLGISFFNVGLNFALSFTGIHLLQGASTALINALNPVITCVLSWLVLKQNMSKRTWLGVLISCIGFLISIRFDSCQITMGTYFLVASTASYALSAVIVKKKASDIPSLVITFYSLFLGAIQLLIVSYWLEGLPIGMLSHLDIKEVLLFFFFSILGFAFIQAIYLRAIDILGPTTTSFYLNLNPIFTYLAAIVMLQESMDIYQIGGLCIILCSLFFSNKKTNKENV